MQEKLNNLTLYSEAKIVFSNSIILIKAADNAAGAIKNLKAISYLDVSNAKISLYASLAMKEKGFIIL